MGRIVDLQDLSHDGLALIGRQPLSQSGHVTLLPRLCPSDQGYVDLLTTQRRNKTPARKSFAQTLSDGICRVISSS